jgi:hypothetical protein
MKFKVGDHVKSTRGDAVGKVIQISEDIRDPNRSYLYLKIEKAAYYPRGYELATYLSECIILQRPVLEPIEKQLVTKINQLYERQQWVKDGKPEALFYIKPPALSVEKKDETGQEITLEFTQTDMSFVSLADITTGNPAVFIPEAEETEIIAHEPEPSEEQEDWLFFPEEGPGPAPSLPEPLSGYFRIPSLSRR